MSPARLPRSFSLFCLFLAALLLAGCGWLGNLLNFGTDTRTETLNALNDAISALQNQSANWQQVLQKTVDKLTKETQSIIRNEVSTLISRSVAQAGTELRCDADFVRERVRQELIGIRANFLGQAVPSPLPAFCQVVPLAVDKELVPDRIKQIEFYGFDFTAAKDLAVYLVNSSGGRTNVTANLDRPTHYAMTLKFGSNGVQLGGDSSRFSLEWGGREISSVAIIQPVTPVCESKVVSAVPGMVGPFIPPKVGTGDNDFNGNGPDVTADVTLSTTTQFVNAVVHMHAKETRSDWTEAEGWQTYALYAAEPNWKIDHLVGKASSSFHYVDSNVTEDSFDFGAAEPVRRMVFVGDSPGDDAGTRTGVRVYFNQIQVAVTQAQNCAPDTALRAIRAAGFLSDRSFLRLNAAMASQVNLRQSHLKTMHLDQIAIDELKH